MPNGLGRDEDETNPSAPSRVASAARQDTDKNEDTSPQISGRKRRRSVSVERPGKRRSISQEPVYITKNEGNSPSHNQAKGSDPLNSTASKGSNPPQTPLSESRCRVCGLPCWGCYSAKKVLHRVGDEGGERRDKSEDLMEPPTAPPSALEFANQVASVTPSEASWSSSNRGKKNDEDKRIYLGPKDDEFNAQILEPCGLIFDDEAVDLNPDMVFGSGTEFVESAVFLQEPKIHIENAKKRLFPICTPWLRQSRTDDDLLHPRGLKRRVYSK